MAQNAEGMSDLLTLGTHFRFFVLNHIFSLPLTYLFPPALKIFSDTWEANPHVPQSSHPPLRRFHRSSARRWHADQAALPDKYNLFTGEGCIHSKLMDTDLPQIERSKLMRQSTDVAGLNATLVGKAGNLNAAICREVINQTGVHYVAAEEYGVPVSSALMMPEAYSRLWVWVRFSSFTRRSASASQSSI